jgi:hypothetical protein
MKWEYERKEVGDKRVDSYLIEMGEAGWELAYARRGRETRANRDPDFWEFIWKRPKGEAGPTASV